MIRINKGDVELSGSIAELLAELTLAINQVYGVVADVVGDEAARKDIVDCGRLAFMTEKEITNNLKEEFNGQ